MPAKQTVENKTIHDQCQQHGKGNHKQLIVMLRAWQFDEIIRIKCALQCSH